MIEKKISYNINIEKPSTTKPVKQGGVLNYLGKQKTVNAPVKWRSSKDHPIAKLAYITKDEEKILIDLNLYGSLKGKPNRGPFGLPSLQGSGSGSGGDSGPGDSGPGGSDDGTGHGGPGDSGPGDSGPGGSDDGTGHGGPGPGVGSEGGFGIGPDAPTEAAQSEAQSISADNVSTQAQADAEDAATAAAAAANTGISGLANRAIAHAMANPISTAIGMAFGPVAGMVASAIGNAMGNTNTNTDTNTDTNTNTDTDTSGGGDGILNIYAPLTNPTTGDNTVDAMRTRLNALLVQRPTSYGIPAVSQLSNYNLLDLVNLRR